MSHTHTTIKKKIHTHTYTYIHAAPHHRMTQWFPYIRAHTTPGSFAPGPGIRLRQDVSLCMYVRMYVRDICMCVCVCVCVCVYIYIYIYARKFCTGSRTSS